MAVAHDPADGEAREEGACGESRDGGDHQQVDRHQAVRLLGETLLDDPYFGTRRQRSDESSVSVTNKLHVMLHHLIIQ